MLLALVALDQLECMLVVGLALMLRNWLNVVAAGINFVSFIAFCMALFCHNGIAASCTDTKRCALFANMQQGHVQ